MTLRILIHDCLLDCPSTPAVYSKADTLTDPRTN